MMDQFFKSCFWLIVASVFLLAVYLQSHIFLAEDVSWLIHVARKMMAGGNYITDFIDADPPPAILIYIFPLLINKFFFTNIITSLHVFIFFISFIVICLCTYLTEKIFDKSEKLIGLALIITLTFTLIILPVGSFGQRDHIFNVLTMPYVFMVNVRLQNKNIPLIIAILVGVLAGVGFSIKPFFLILLFFIEIYYMYVKRNIFSWIRVETLIILLFLLSNIAITIFLFPNYFLIAKDSYEFIFINHFFKPQYTHPYFYALILYCLFTIACYFIFNSRHHQTLSKLFLLGLIATYASFYIQGGPLFYYHIEPIIAYCYLLLTLLLGIFAKKLFSLGFLKNKIYLVTYIIIVISFLFFVFPISNNYQMYQTALIEKEYGDKKKIITLLQQNKSVKTCYFITPYLMSYPMVDYAHIVSSSRFYNYLMLNNILRDRLRTSNNPKREKYLSVKAQQYLEMGLSELISQPPDLLFIDTFKSPSFREVINLLYQAEALKNFWQQYKFKAFIANYKVYQHQHLN